MSVEKLTTKAIHIKSLLKTDSIKVRYISPLIDDTPKEYKILMMKRKFE